MNTPAGSEKAEKFVPPALSSKLAKLGYLLEEVNDYSDEILFSYQKTISEHLIMCWGAYDLSDSKNDSRWTVEVGDMPAFLNGRLREDVEGECIVGKGNEDDCIIHIEEWDKKALFAIQGLGKTLTVAEKLVAKSPKLPSPFGKVGRNEICPCGSGKKFKRCHGENL